MSDPIFDVSGAVAVLNQTLEYAFPTITVVGELADFKIWKEKFIYADLKDDVSKLPLFGTVFQMPGPLENGMKLEVVAEPRIHHKSGFSLRIKSIRPVGEGSIKKAADLLRIKLEKEGLFTSDRKRLVPFAPSRIGLITSEKSAAYADFIKILNSRWQGVDVEVYDAQVQGEASRESLIQAIRYFNTLSSPPEVLVITRGGGSADDLGAFSLEPVVRAVSASRVPTLVAIGHEIDESLAELAADMRASTPSNAAELLFPDRKETSTQLKMRTKNLVDTVYQHLDYREKALDEMQSRLLKNVENSIELKSHDLKLYRSILEGVHPKSTLKRGYALVQTEGKLVKSVSQLNKGKNIDLTMHDGDAKAKVQ